MASTNQQIEPCYSDRLCEVRNHDREQRPAEYILSYEYRGGKLRDKKIVARRPACSKCAASFARTNNLAIPPHKITLRQKVKEINYRCVNDWYLCSVSAPDIFMPEIYQDLKELVALVKVTYGL